MNKSQQRFLQCLLLSFVSSAHFLADTKALTSYGTMELTHNNVPWFPYNKLSYPPTYPTYTAKPSWYPVAGPYSYGPPEANPVTLPSQQSGFHQQQIVHIHDVGPPDLPRGDNYQEGIEYNINNVISHAQTPYDLAEVASAKVETRKQNPKTRIKATTAASRRRSTSKSSNRSKSKGQKQSERIQQVQNTKARRTRPATKAQSNVRPKSSSRKSSSRLSYEQKRKLQRRSSQRRTSSQTRRTRPTRRPYSRNPYYDYSNYNDFYNGRRRRYNDYQNYEVDDSYELSSEEDLARQDDEADDYENDTDDDFTTTEPTTTETETVETTSLTTVTTTETPETTPATETTTEGTTSTINNPGGYDYHFGGYGPSNGNENISITYAPGSDARLDFDNPISNFWYRQQGSPDAFHFQNYFSPGGTLE